MFLKHLLLQGVHTRGEERRGEDLGHPPSPKLSKKNVHNRMKKSSPNVNLKASIFHSFHTPGKHGLIQRPTMCTGVSYCTLCG